jgi:hypothetical protein
MIACLDAPCWGERVADRVEFDTIALLSLPQPLRRRLRESDLWCGSVRGYRVSRLMPPIRC